MIGSSLGRETEVGKWLFKACAKPDVVRTILEDAELALRRNGHPRPKTRQPLSKFRNRGPPLPNPK
eukprot:5448849-Amphidinium_carterae.1